MRFIGSAVIINSVFYGNRHTAPLGKNAIFYGDIITAIKGPTIINSIIWTNTDGKIGAEQGLANHKIALGGSVLYDGTNNILVGSQPATVSSYEIVTNDPQLIHPIYKDFSTYPTIRADSVAVNKGLMVKIQGSFDLSGLGTGATLYYSTDGQQWYTTIGNGTLETSSSPDTARNLTATDITGRVRMGRPDIGVYELQ